MAEKTNYEVRLYLSLKYLSFLTQTIIDPSPEMIKHITPEDLEQEELKTYAEVYAALTDFEDLDGIDWSLSDLEDIAIVSLTSWRKLFYPP